MPRPGIPEIIRKMQADGSSASDILEWVIETETRRLERNNDRVIRFRERKRQGKKR